MPPVKDNGDVVVKIGGDATLDISKEYIHWDKNHSANYDITVKKSNTTDNTLKKDDNGKYEQEPSHFYYILSWHVLAITSNCCSFVREMNLTA